MMIGTVLQGGSLFVSHYLLASRVPFERLPTETQCNIPQMTDSNGAMRHFGRRCTLFAVDHTVDEVTKMIVALIKMDFIRAYFRLQDGA